MDSQERPEWVKDFEFTRDGRILSSGTYIGLDEAAARSGFSRATLLNWVRKKRFPAILDYDETSRRERWQVLDRDLEDALGQKLAPSVFDLRTELAGLRALLASSIDMLTDDASGTSEPPVDRLRFAEQWLDDLRRRVGHEERTSS